MTMCLCLSSAWQQLRSHPSRLFYSARPVPVSQGLWLVVAAAGGLLLLDTFGGLSVSVYAFGFDAALAWTGWLCALIWLMLAYWFDLPVWHVQVAGSWLVATGLFVFTRAPSGNVWDAWLDPWLWLLAMTKITTYWWRQRMRSSHS
jgi:hypothetical protein